jgi:hypothetical protein
MSTQQTSDVPPPVEVDPNAPAPICPILTLAGETFERELPDLIRLHHHKWVAYHGARRLGIAKTCPDAERLGDAEGIHPYEVAVWCIEDEPQVNFIGMGGGYGPPCHDPPS